MKKIVIGAAIVCFAVAGLFSVNMTNETNDDSSLGIFSAQACPSGEVIVDPICMAPAGSCSGWSTWARN